MEGALEGDDARPSRREPRDLDGVLDGLGARVEERRARRACERRQLAETLGELDVAGVGDDREVGVDKPRSLLLDRLDDVRVAVADVAHTDAAREVHERVAVDVGDGRVPRLFRKDRQVDLERLGNRRSRRAREAPESAGPGTSVRSSIVRVVATIGA